MVKIKSHVTEFKSFIWKPPLVYPDQVFLLMSSSSRRLGISPLFILLSVAKTYSHVITQSTRLILNHLATRWNRNDSYTQESNQHKTRSPSQMIIPVALLDMPPTTHQPQTSRYISLSSPSISMVNNPPRMHKFLSSTFACIWSKIVQVFVSHRVCIRPTSNHLSILGKVQCQITTITNQALQSGHYPTSRIIQCQNTVTSIQGDMPGHCPTSR